MPADVRAVVHQVLGTHGDETILDYVIGALQLCCLITVADPWGQSAATLQQMSKPC